MPINPADGDIVVRQNHRDGTLVYVLHVAPGPDQYVVHSREEAIAQAVTMAKRQHVRAWFTTDTEYEFVRLGTSLGVRRSEGQTDELHLADCEWRLHSVIDRLHAEFTEMPGLRLTPKQAQRLCGVERSVCQLVLDTLVEERFLRVNRDGCYRRRADGHHPRSAKAHLNS